MTVNRGPVMRVGRNVIHRVYVSIVVVDRPNQLRESYVTIEHERVHLVLVLAVILMEANCLQITNKRIEIIIGAGIGRLCQCCKAG